MTDEEKIQGVTDRLLDRLYVGARVRAGKKRRPGTVIRIYGSVACRVKFDEPLSNLSEVAGHALIGRDNLEWL